MVFRDFQLGLWHDGGMRRFVDLHTHSTASDGGLDPQALIDLAEKCQLAAVGLTDHDTTAGLARAAARAAGYPELTFVPGIEVSALLATRPGATLHILGLGIDPEAPKLQALTANLREARIQRNPRIVEKLQAVGIDITLDDVFAVANAAAIGLDPEGRIVSRVHFAQVLMQKKVVATFFDAFEQYLGTKGQAYVPKDRLAPREVFDAIHAAGGAAFLAHPPSMQYDNDAQLKRLVHDLVEAGLDGIECYHNTHTLRETRVYLDLADQLGLLVSGGSDFHGAGKPAVPLGRPKTPKSMIDPRFR